MKKILSWFKKIYRFTIGWSLAVYEFIKMFGQLLWSIYKSEKDFYYFLSATASIVISATTLVVMLLLTYWWKYYFSPWYLSLFIPLLAMLWSYLRIKIFLASGNEDGKA
jgi:hypothetical protein